MWWDGVRWGGAGVVSYILWGRAIFITMGGFLAVSIHAALELYDASLPSLITRSH